MTLTSGEWVGEVEREGEEVEEGMRKAAGDSWERRGMGG